jgi:hypothetical protein
MIPQINETDYAARLFPDALDFFRPCSLRMFGCLHARERRQRRTQDLSLGGDPMSVGVAVIATAFKPKDGMRVRE